jgi:hypothetical protein
MAILVDCDLMISSGWHNSGTRASPAVYSFFYLIQLIQQVSHQTDENGTGNTHARFRRWMNSLRKGWHSYPLIHVLSVRVYLVAWYYAFRTFIYIKGGVLPPKSCTLIYISREVLCNKIHPLYAIYWLLHCQRRDVKADDNMMPSSIENRCRWKCVERTDMKLTSSRPTSCSTTNAPNSLVCCDGEEFVDRISWSDFWWRENIINI